VAVSFVFNLLMALATFALWDTWAGLIAQWFHTNREILGPLMVYFFSAVKFYIIFILLTPALALHWTIKREMARKVA
jgi:hypothetical protein